MVEGYLEELQGMRKPRAGGSTGHGPCRSIWRAAGITWFDVPVRATIYLPDDLAQAVEAYFKEHPETSFSALVQEALRARLRRNPAALLELAGVVEKAKGSARERAEDRPNRQER